MAEVVVEGKLRGSSLLPLYYYCHRHQFATTITINPSFRLPRVPRSMWGISIQASRVSFVSIGHASVGESENQRPGRCVLPKYIKFLACLPLQPPGKWERIERYDSSKYLVLLLRSLHRSRWNDSCISWRAPILWRQKGPTALR